MKYTFTEVRLADVSTNNITAEDGVWIGRADCPYRLGEEDDGSSSFFYVPDGFDADDALELARFGLSGEFQEIFRQAAAQGIQYLRINADGFSIPEAKEFNW